MGIPEPMDIDEIEAEYTIHIKNPSQPLLHLKFPTQVNLTPLPTHARFKPKAQMLEIDVPLNTDSINPVQAAALVGNSGDSDNTLTHQTFSSHLIPNASTYYSAAIRGSQVHFTPVSCTYSMTPSLDYLDKLNIKQEVEQEAKLIQVQVSKKSDNPEDEFKNSYVQGVKSRLDEKWIKLQCFHETSKKSQELRKSMYNESNIELNIESTLESYINLVSPKINISIPEKVSYGQSLNVIRSMPLHLMIKNLMVNASILPFSKIRHEIPINYSNNEIITELVSCCTMTRGVWIIKSEFMYKDRPMYARRILISKFIDCEFVKMNEFNQTCKLTLYMSTNMFSEICVKSEFGWKLKFTDTCIDLDLVLKQDDVVLKLADEALEYLDQQAPVFKQSRQETLGEYRIDFQFVGNNVTDQIKDIIETLLKYHGIISLRLIKMTLDQLKHNKHPLNLIKHTEIPDDSITHLLNQISVCVNELFILKRVDSSLDEFRIILFGLFKDRDGVRKADVMGALKKTGKDVPATVYGKLMKEFCVSKGNVWSLKACPSASSD